MSKITKYRKMLKRAFREQNKDLLDRLLGECYKTLGDQETEALLRDDIIPNLSSHQHEWMIGQMPEHLQEEIKEESKQTVIEILIDGGFQFGSDFSVTSDMIAISDRAKEYLLEQVPEENRPKIESQLVSMDSDPYQLVNEQVGVEFFNNLVKIARSRLSGIDDSQAAGYLMNITEGIKMKHPELSGFDDWFLSQVLSQERMKQLSEIEESGDCSFFMEDILLALEKDDLIQYQECDGQIQAMMTIDEFKAINQVWESETYPLREIIAKLEQARRDQ